MSTLVATISSPVELTRQPERDLGKQEEKNDQAKWRQQERQDAAIDVGDTDIRRLGLDDEQVHPDRWMDQTEFNDDDDNDREPDRIVAELHDQRQEYRNGDQHHADAFEKTSHDDVGDDNDCHDQARR